MVQHNKQLDNQLQASHSRDFSVLLTGASLVFVGIIAQRGLDFVTRAAIARYLGVEGFGVLSTGVGVLSVAGSIILFGLPSGLVRFVGQYQNTNPDSIAGFVYSAFWFVVLVSGGLGLVAWLFAKQIALTLLHDPYLASVVRLVGLSLPLFVSLAVISATFQALKDMRAYVLVNNLLLPGIRLAGILVAVLLGWGLTNVLSIYLCFSLGVSVIVAVVLLQKHSLYLFSLQQDIVENLVPLLRFSAPLVLGVVFVRAVWQVDIILLQRMRGATEVGFYAAALMVGRLPNMLLFAFELMISPFIAQQYSEDRLPDMRKMYGRVVDLTFMVGLPLVAAIVMFAPLVLKVLFGVQYLQAVNVLRLIAIGYFLHNITGPNARTLIMMGRSKLYLMDTAIVAVVTLLLYIFLIPNYGMMGAAVGSLGGLILANVLFSGQLFQQTGINPWPWLRLRLLGVVISTSLLGIFVQNYLAIILSDWLLLGLVLVVHFAAYLGLALLLRIIRLAEVFAFRDLLMKNLLSRESEGTK